MRPSTSQTAPQDTSVRKDHLGGNETILQPSAVHCPRGGIARYSFHGKICLLPVDGCSLVQIAGEALAAFGECRRSEPVSAHQYAHGSRGSAAGVLGSAADGAVASRHADHGADGLQAQRRPIRTAKDRFSIEGSVGDAIARHTASPRRKRSNDVRLCRSRRRSETP